MCALLTTLIKDHTLYMELFSQPLKPKHHYVVHYPKIIKTIASISHLNTLRYERKHREAETSANVVASRVTLTTAIKHQLKLCERLFYNSGFAERKT